MWTVLRSVRWQTALLLSLLDKALVSYVISKTAAGVVARLVLAATEIPPTTVNTEDVKKFVLSVDTGIKLCY
jgi:hypothetical protein